MKLKYIFFLIFFQLIVASCFGQETTSKSTDISLITSRTNFGVADEIILEFKTKNQNNLNLYCSNSYGSAVIEPVISEKKIIFKIPHFLSKKRGILSWKLLNTKEPVFGNITIESQQKPVNLETYLGPPSIDAGRLDYTMLVVIPTDSLDNPIIDKSKVTVKHQFLKSERTQTVYTDKLIAYKNIYSPLKSGRMIISSESFGLDSKEFDVNIMPAIATNFKIYVKRNHEYADGNQITTFYTSTIKDKNKNIVSDGSYIEFYITNKKGNILKTSGTTLNGVAMAKIIHPDFEDNWKVKAYFIGIAESNTITVAYKKVISSYDVTFSKKNRNIKVGPLKSFMNQIIPDGLSIKLSIFKDNKLLKEFYNESNKGFTEFYLDPNIYENGNYKIIVETAAIQKEFKNFKIW